MEKVSTSSMVCYSIVQSSTEDYGTVHNATQYSIIQYSMVQNQTVLYDIVDYSILVQCRTQQSSI